MGELILIFTLSQLIQINARTFSGRKAFNMGISTLFLLAQVSVVCSAAVSVAAQ